MNRVMVESPYAAANGRTVEMNINYARWCLRHSLDQGEAPFASHLLYTQTGVLDDTIEKERLQGLQAGYEWMHQADVVAFYVDNGWSRGMLKALKMARILHRKIEVRHVFGAGEYMPPNLEVHEQLLRAGVVEEHPASIPGILRFRFRREP